MGIPKPLDAEKTKVVMDALLKADMNEIDTAIMYQVRLSRS